jgi:hypothetical protein
MAFNGIEIGAIVHGHSWAFWDWRRFDAQTFSGQRRADRVVQGPARLAAFFLASPAKRFYLRVQFFVFDGQHIVGLRPRVSRSFG